VGVQGGQFNRLALALQGKKPQGNCFFVALRLIALSGEFALREFNAESKKIYENLRILCRQVGWQRPPGGRQPGDRTNMRGHTKMRTEL